MIVYMLLNVKAEMAYVGSTEIPLEDRFAAHWEKCASRSSPLYRAMRETLKSDWERVVLEEYSDLESMLWGEVEWMHELGTTHPRVGYNSQVPSAHDIAAKLQAGGSVSRTSCGANPAARPRAEMTPEELAYFREMGRRGAARAAELGDVTPREIRVANGKKGAEALWSRPDARQLHRERTVPAAVEGRKRWWESLSEEEKEAHRERGRVSAKNNKKRVAS